MMKEPKSLKIELETKNALDKIKVHKRESYDDVIKRILKEHNKVIIKKAK